MPAALRCPRGARSAWGAPPSRRATPRAAMNKPDDFDCWRLPDDDSIQKCAARSPIASRRPAHSVRAAHTCTRAHQVDRAEGDEDRQRGDLYHRARGPHAREYAPHVRRHPPRSRQPAAPSDRSLSTRVHRQLLDDPQVIFSGYRQPHPLEPAIQLRVQTRSEQPGPEKARARVTAMLAPQRNQRPLPDTPPPLRTGDALGARSPREGAGHPPRSLPRGREEQQGGREVDAAAAAPVAAQAGANAR